MALDAAFNEPAPNPYEKMSSRERNTIFCKFYDQANLPVSLKEKLPQELIKNTRQSFTPEDHMAMAAALGSRYGSETLERLQARMGQLLETAEHTSPEFKRYIAEGYEGYYVFGKVEDPEKNLPVWVKNHQDDEGIFSQDPELVKEIEWQSYRDAQKVALQRAATSGDTLRNIYEILTDVHGEEKAREIVYGSGPLGVLPAWRKRLGGDHKTLN